MGAKPVWWLPIKTVEAPCSFKSKLLLLQIKTVEAPWAQNARTNYEEWRCLKNAQFTYIFIGKKPHAQEYCESRAGHTLAASIGSVSFRGLVGAARGWLEATGWRPALCDAVHWPKAAFYRCLLAQFSVIQAVRNTSNFERKSEALNVRYLLHWNKVNHACCNMLHKYVFGVTSAWVCNFISLFTEPTAFLILILFLASKKGFSARTFYVI